MCEKVIRLLAHLSLTMSSLGVGEPQLITKNTKIKNTIKYTRTPNKTQIYTN